LSIPDAFGVAGLPAPDGESIMFGAFGTILDPESGSEAGHMTGWEHLARGESGWDGEALNNLPTYGPGGTPINQMTSVSADLKTSGWRHLAFMFPPAEGEPFGTEGGTKVIGDTGGYQGSGWYPWPGGEAAGLAGENGSFMVRWNEVRGLMENPDTAAVEDPSSLQTGGAAPYMTSPPDWQAHELLSGCTGTVVASEQQLVSVGATGGTFTLTFEGQTTTATPFNASATVLRGRLENLSNLEPGDGGR
jgi:hypothetical protein